jgi:hypothetical protein
MIDFQTEQQELGRAKNAVQDHLIHKLLFPKIYLDANWDGTQVDVLAIDREGSGDAHVVRIVSARPHFVPPQLGHELTMVSENEEFDQHMVELKAVPAHYRYLAALIAGSRLKDYYAGSKLQQATLAGDGVGRIGILFLDLTGSDIAVKPIIKPERFRSTPRIIELVDNYVAANQANWELRE